ncbi:MAG: tRNA threonylcarbamoyladenosine dehydratase [Erysipelotrichaceae bacterium]|nr:tRNA threonylcarbamoyladenosine dehydratase [Erysipelotrichaceae bacterium]MDY6034622.1 tRNA threonylcarbamoyladenosine dehydratase [Bulleidia sp.]
MINRFARTQRVIGRNALQKIKQAHVCVFGVGGVGGYAIEALARSGIGKIDIVDHDTVSLTNINRQIIATEETINQYKVDIMAKRIHSISPDTIVRALPIFYLPETKEQFDFTQYDYIIDAIDNVTAKVDLITTAQKLNVPIISAMGCGNRFDPTKVQIMDLYDTKNDPLAKVMRRELRTRGVKKLLVCCSTELPVKPLEYPDEEQEKAVKWSIPGSTAFVPPVAGITLAAKVIQDITNYDPNNRE